MAKFFWGRERGKGRQRLSERRRCWKRRLKDREKWKEDGGSCMRVEQGGLFCRDTCYLWVHRSLFAGQRGIDFLSMSVPLFGAQRWGDKSEIIHYWFRINFQAKNINSQPKKRKCRICQNAQTNKDFKKASHLTINLILSLSYEHIISPGPAVLSQHSVWFYIHLHNDFL